MIASYFIISGCGTSIANGKYTASKKVRNGVPVYVNANGLNASREKVKGEFGWIIGKTPTVFYAARSGSVVPPSSGWRRYSGKSPPPASFEIFFPDSLLPQKRELSPSKHSSNAQTQNSKQTPEQVYSEFMYDTLLITEAEYVSDITLANEIVSELLNEENFSVPNTIAISKFESIKAGTVVTATRGSKQGKHGTVLIFDETANKWLVNWGLKEGGPRLYKEVNLKVSDTSTTSTIQQRTRSEVQSELSVLLSTLTEILHINTILLNEINEKLEGKEFSEVVPQMFADSLVSLRKAYTKYAISFKSCIFQLRSFKDVSTFFKEHVNDLIGQTGVCFIFFQIRICFRTKLCT